MVEKKSQEALAENDETQSQPNIKLDVCLPPAVGAAERREMPGLGREKF